MAVFINFGAIYVNAIENNSGLFFGENVQSGFDSHSKNNQGVGQIFGNGDLVLNPLNLLNDTDAVDTPINDQDFQATSSPLILKGV